MIKTDYLIVGCGLYGSVLAERISNVLGKKVIIIDRRDHIAGNCYSLKDASTGIEYHKFGTHTFHTITKWYGNMLINLLLSIPIDTIF